jgi:flagellar hook-associated protein 2
MPGPITITGLGSSLDIESIIEKLMQTEEGPRNRVEVQAGRVKARETALQGLLGKLESVSSALEALKSPTLWSDTQTITSSSSSITAALTGGAGPGGYQVEVTQLARAEQRTYVFTESAEATTLTIGGKTIDLAAGATLAEAVSAINSNGETGVSAVAVGGKLVLSSRTTGAESTIGAAGAAITEEAAKTKLGLDALYSVDGIAGSSASNVLTEAIPGVSLTATAVTQGPITINVGEPGPDATKIAAAVKTFVSAYNAAVEAIEAKLGEEPVKEPATQEEANRGVLFGDDSLNSLLSGMRETISESGIASLGVSTGPPSTSVTPTSSSVRGLLVFEESDLTAALQTDPLAAKATLSGATGFVAALEPEVAAAARPGGGLAEQISAATTEAAALRESLVSLDERLQSREERLQAQFAAMEVALARSKSESEFLKGQIEGLS